MKTIKRSRLATITMVAGEERHTGKVIDGDRVKEWVGIGWIDLGPATAAQRRRLPHVRDDKLTWKDGDLKQSRRT